MDFYFSIVFTTEKQAKDNGTLNMILETAFLFKTLADLVNYWQVFLADIGNFCSESRSLGYHTFMCTDIVVCCTCCDKAGSHCTHAVL